MPRQQAEAFLASLTATEAAALKYDWSFWARDDQLLPPGDWIYWMPLAGRGWGKTRCGAETVRAWIKQGYRQVNLIGATENDVEKVMIKGPSGILAVCPPEEWPRYIRNNHELRWPNGAVSVLFSAEKYDRLRGHNHEKLWCDELASWRYADAFDQALLGLRGGDKPQAVITTTPRPTKLIKELRADPDTHFTTGSTYDNFANLATTFLKNVVKKYEGTRLGRQELGAEILDDAPGALWTRSVLDRAFIKAIPPGVELRRVVIALDPAVTSGEDADEFGIIVAALGSDGHGYVLEDATGRYSVAEWPKEAIRLYRKHKADRIVAEVNNGGDMIEATLRMVDASVSYSGVHATRGKVVRAEPAAALYEKCIAGGTLVETEHGRIPIENVAVGYRVWTRDGLKRVLWSGQTGIRETVIISHDYGELECTNDHPVFCRRGLISACQLVPKADMLLAWQKENTNNTSALTVALRSGSRRDAANHVARLSGGRLVQSSANLLCSMVSDISSRLTDIGNLLAIRETNCCIATCGVRNTGLYRPAFISTTKTKIRATTRSETFKTWILARTLNYITIATKILFTAPKHTQDLRKFNANGGSSCNPRTVFADTAERYSKAGELGSDSALRPVTLDIGITRKRSSGPKPVYNLHVEDCHEFFAGGVLVHNCLVHHVGSFPKLEDEMAGFTSDYDRSRDGSPNRVDACLIAGTMVSTINGLSPIENVIVGDLVLTRQGYKRVIRSEMTAHAANTTIVGLSNGNYLAGSGNHPIYIKEKGFIPIDELVCGDILLPEHECNRELVWKSRQSKSNSTALFIDATRDAAIRALRDITPASATANTIPITGICGKAFMALFQRAITSTIATTTFSTIASIITNACLRLSMQGAMSVALIANGRVSILPKSGILPQHGTLPRLVERGTQLTERGLGRGASASLSASVPIAESKFTHSSRGGSPTDIVPANVAELSPTARENTKSNAIARFVRRCFWPANIGKSPKRAAVFVEQLCEGRVQPVFNLQVEDCPEFFANGILVHNCVWALTELKIDPSGSTGMLDHYRLMAEAAAGKKNGAAPATLATSPQTPANPPLFSDKPAAPIPPEFVTLIVPPANRSGIVCGLSRKEYAPDAMGMIKVVAEDAPPLKRAGFVEVMVAA